MRAHSQALAAAANGLRANEEELALGDLDDLGRVGIVCDGCDDVRGAGPYLAQARAYARQTLPMTARGRGISGQSGTTQDGGEVRTASEDVHGGGRRRRRNYRGPGCSAPLKGSVTIAV